MTDEMQINLCENCILMSNESSYIVCTDKSINCISVTTGTPEIEN